MIARKTPLNNHTRQFLERSVYGCTFVGACENSGRVADARSKLRLKSAEKAEEEEEAAVMNEWLKRLIYGPGLNALTLPLGEHLYQLKEETGNENWSGVLYAPPAEVTFPWMYINAATPWRANIEREFKAGRTKILGAIRKFRQENIEVTYNGVGGCARAHAGKRRGKSSVWLP